MIDRITWLLLYLREQCMPMPIDGEPGAVDYLVVAVAALSVAGGAIWFVRALAWRDSPRIQAIKAQVLED
ncbi:MAG: hypothetical protein AAF074_21565 [Pseudomonadota bacterium]